MVSAYVILIARLKAAGIEPKIHLLDNECSQEHKDNISGNGIKYQLLPPNDHRRNIAKKLSKHSKITLSQFSVGLLSSSLCNFGVASYTKPNIS